MKKVSNWIRPFLLGGGLLNLVLAFLFLLIPIKSHEVFFGDASFLSPQAIQVYGILLFTLGIGYMAVGVNPLNNTAVLFMALLANGVFAAYLPTVAGSMFWLYPAAQLWVLAALAWSGLLMIIMYRVARARQVPQALTNVYQEPMSRTLSRFRTHRGRSLLQLTNERPTLVVFLRHLGSSLCRKSLEDIRQQRRGIEEKGTQIVLVHLAEQGEASDALQKYDLADLHRISDPNGIMYNAFGLKRGTNKEHFSWGSWLASLLAGIGSGHYLGALARDEGGRMPGVFLISKGEIVRSYRQSFTSPRPDFRQLASEQEQAA